MPLIHIRKKSNIFLRVLQFFGFLYVVVDGRYAETVFCCEISTTKFKVHFGPIKWVSFRFFELLITYIPELRLILARKRFYRWLSQRGNNFIDD
jgi:hypothetical protein